MSEMPATFKILIKHVGPDIDIRWKILDGELFIFRVNLFNHCLVCNGVYLYKTLVKLSNSKHESAEALLSVVINLSLR